MKPPNEIVSADRRIGEIAAGRLESEAARALLQEYRSLSASGKEAFVAALIGRELMRRGQNEHYA